MRGNRRRNFFHIFRFKARPGTSYTTYVVCVNFVHEWRDQQFNVNSERQIVWETFSWQVNFTLRVFARYLLIFFFIYFVLMPNLGLLTPLMLFALILYISGGGPTEFLRNFSAERKSPKKYFFFSYFCFDVCPGGQPEFKALCLIKMVVTSIFKETYGWNGEKHHYLDAYIVSYSEFCKLYTQLLYWVDNYLQCKFYFYFSPFDESKFTMFRSSYHFFNYLQ